MRVALCLYGTMGGTMGKAGERNGNKMDVFQHAFPHYKKFILDVNDVDVFIHSWDTDIEEEVVCNYNPIDCKFEEQITFDIPDHIDKTQRVQNHFSRWYSCKEVVELKKMYEVHNKFEYDFVMLARQDIAWQSDIVFSKYDNEYFYVAEWYQHHTGVSMGYPNGSFNQSLQDIWLFSNSEYINSIVEIYDDIPSFHSENNVLSQYKGISNHRLIYYKLLKMGLIPDKLKFAMRHDRLGFGETPLVKWLYFGDKT